MVFSPEKCFLQCDLETRSISITWKLVRSGNPQASPRPTESETQGAGLDGLCSNKPSDGSHGSAAWEKWRTPSSEAQWKGLGRETSVCRSQGLDCFCGMTALRGQGVGEPQPVRQV